MKHIIYRDDTRRDLPPRAVAFTGDTGTPLPVTLWHGTTGIQDEPGYPPRTSTPLSIREARELGAALIAAAEQAAALCLDRCRECGEPIDLTALYDEPAAEDEGRCIGCFMTATAAARRERRSRLRVVE